MPTSKTNTIKPAVATKCAPPVRPYWNDTKKWEDKVLGIDVKALEAMSMRELRALSASLNTINEVAQAITCQPRCHNDSDDGVYDLNGVGQIIERISGFFNCYRDTVLRVAHNTWPEDADEVEERSWAIVGFEADMGDCMLDLATTVASENKAITAAKLKKARRA